MSVHETPALAKVVYQPQAQVDNGSAPEEAVDTVEIEEEQPLWQGVRTQVLQIPQSTSTELIAGSLVSIDVTSRLTDPFWSRRRLPTLRFNAYPVFWDSVSEPFAEIKDQITTFLKLAETAIEPAFLGVRSKQFESTRLWYRVNAVVGSLLLILGVALGVTVDFGIFAVAGGGVILLGLAVLYCRPRMLRYWYQIKEDLVAFIMRDRGKLPERVTAVVGAYGMYVKFRIDLPGFSR